MALKRIKVNNTQYDINDARINGIVDNLTSTDTDKVLSANQGKVLKGLVDTKTSNVGTITAITATNGLTGGTITNSGEIGLEEYTNFIDSNGIEFDKYGRAVTSFQKWVDSVEDNGATIQGNPYYCEIFETRTDPTSSEMIGFLQSLFDNYWMTVGAVAIYDNKHICTSFSLYDATLSSKKVIDYDTIFTCTSVVELNSFSAIPTTADKVDPNTGYILQSFDSASMFLIGCKVEDNDTICYFVANSSESARTYYSQWSLINHTSGINTIPFYAEANDNYVPIDNNQYYWLTGSKREDTNQLYLGVNSVTPTKNKLTWGGDLSTISDISSKAGSDYTYWTYKDPVTNTWIYFIYIESAWRGYIPVDQQKVYNYTAGAGIKIDEHIISIEGFDGDKGYAADFTLATGATSITITHDLNTLDVIVQVYNKTTNANVIVDVTRTGLNTIQLDFNETSTDTYRVLITNTTGLSNKNIAANYKNISVSVTPTAVSSYKDWDTNQTYGYSADISIIGITENSLILNIVMTDTLLSAVASVVTTGTNKLTVYTSSADTLTGTIISLYTQEVENG